jgi:hypothetical protein
MTRAGEGGRPTPVRGAGGRPAQPLPAPYGGAGAAAAAPLPYDTSPGLAAWNANRDVPDGGPPSGPIGPPAAAERRRHGDAPRGREARAGGATAILPAPGLRPAPAPTAGGPTPAEVTGSRAAVRAVPDPDAVAGGRPPGGPAGHARTPGLPSPGLPSPARSGRSGRGRRDDQHEETAERDAPLPARTAPEPDRAERLSPRPLRSVDADPDASENTGIHYGFEDEPSLLLQWGGFIMQTVLGAACGLGVWLGFYQLWERWPFYSAPAAGAAMAVMLAVTRAIRRRYGHDLDLLTAILTVGVGVVLTVLPAAFVLQHV